MRLICVHAVDVLAVVTSSPPRTPAMGSIKAGSNVSMPTEMALKSAALLPVPSVNAGIVPADGTVLFFM